MVTTGDWEVIETRTKQQPWGAKWTVTMECCTSCEGIPSYTLHAHDGPSRQIGDACQTLEASLADLDKFTDYK